MYLDLFTKRHLIAYILFGWLLACDSQISSKEGTSDTTGVVENRAAKDTSIPNQAAMAQLSSKLDTIRNTTVEPFSQVCYLEIFRVRKAKRDRYFQSTGFLIAPNIILTAAHNIYSNSLTKVTNILIYPGRYMEQYSYDSIEIPGETLCQRSIRVHPKFNWNRADFDFGIIIIPDSILKKIKHWPASSCFNLDTNYHLLESESIHVAGFPASHGYDGSLMTSQVQQCGKVLTNTFSHEFDTQTGNSGSPIWIETNGRRNIVGIHTYAGVATKIDSKYINLILEWIRK